MATMYVTVIIAHDNWGCTQTDAENIK